MNDWRLLRCTVDGCSKLQQRQGLAVCEAHYYRMRRTGSFGDTVVVAKRPRKLTCDYPDCGAGGRVTRGLCAAHYSRWLRYGTTELQGHIPQPGADNVNWRGDGIGYSAAHMRVRSMRGPATDHHCVDCGGPAVHWSYDHADPAEQRGAPAPGDKPLPFSPDSDHYQPRCVSCHKHFDRAASAA